MNIHIDISTKQMIDTNVIFASTFGSRMYKSNDENSDTDIMCIYIPSLIERNTLFYTHHQLQYKDISIDYIYTNYLQFIKNIIQGDSTVNLEILLSGDMKNSVFDFLYQNRFKFITTKILKCYVGMARRDLRASSKTDDYMRKINHAYRGYLFAKQLLENPTEFKCEYTKLPHMDYKEVSKFRDDLMNDISTLRNKINEEKIDISPIFMAELDKFISTLPIKIWDMDYSKQYFHYNNDINYEI